MPTTTYAADRAKLEIYFDQTARDAWAQLTSTAKVSGIRATVRAGRDRMRATLLSWLPRDLTGRRVLDAGCGTGALAVEAAWRGAEVVAIDVSRGLVEIAKARAPADLGPGRIDFHVGDMLDPGLGRFDHVVAMDSLIHYGAGDIAAALGRLAERTDQSILFTFAPQNPMLSLMHAAGKLFPRTDRAPAIVPVAEDTLRLRFTREPALANFAPAGSERVVSGFYTSHALELVRK